MPDSPVPPAELAAVRDGRIVFRARRPAALVVPFALFTEAAGVVFVVEGVPIGWFVIPAPPRGEVIEPLGVTRAGNRTVLAYKRVEGVPPPRRQPAASLLRAAGRPFDGGWFADSLAGSPEDILAVVDGYLRDPARRAA